MGVHTQAGRTAMTPHRPSMRIVRVQVEEGFLDGLDLEFGAGLNVIIGARGTGKTSLIELIRFGLGGSGFTVDAARRSEAHAHAVLGSGQVVVTLESAGDRIIAARTSSEAAPRLTAPVTAPLILSQAEVEALGLHAAGRLRLVDGFVEASRDLSAREGGLVAEAASLTAEISSKRAELEKIEQQLAALPGLLRQLEELAPAERAVSQASAAAAEKTTELRAVSDRLAACAVSDARYERFLALNAQRRALLDQLLRQWAGDEPAGEDPRLAEGLLASATAKDRLLAAVEALAQGGAAVDAARERLAAERLSAEAAARTLRKEVEAIQLGAGQVVRQSQQLRERAAHLASLEALSEERRRALAAVTEGRNGALERLDALRDERFASRAAVAEMLNSHLGPRIMVEVERAGQVEAYAGALAASLRGSGIRYNDLSQVLAESVSPRELLEWVEGDDAAALADAARLPRDRAARSLAALRRTDLSEMATLLVEDDVRMSLLDGADHKPISVLSMGQRATVVLPIVLERRDAVIIMDQPEDHMDNAFITETLIRTIVRRSSSDQIILTTHNANIPVLGEADRVVQLGSDGRRGFVMVNAPLRDAAAVAAITGVMEGGKTAFERRADFYARPV